MEPHDERLPGISLDSVVEKASELERLLRGCIIAAEHEKPQTPPLQEGRGHTSSSTSRVNTSDFPSPRPEADGDAVAGLNTHWHQLSTYIVGLEKEMRYYKQLVDDNQRTSASHAPTQEHGMQPLPHQSRQSERVSPHKSEEIFAADNEFWTKLLEKDGECKILLSIFGYLTTAEVCRAARVCRKWYTMSKHPNLWRRVRISEAVITSQTLVTLSQWCSRTEQLSLHGLMPEMASCNEDLQTYIARMKGSLEPGLAALFSVCSQTLTSISFDECNLMITERVFWLLSIHCPNLEVLTYSSDEFPPSCEALWCLAQGCQGINCLQFPPLLSSPNSGIFNDSCLLQLAHSWPKLLSLTVGGQEISVSGLTEVAQHCRHLTHLEVMHGPDFDKDTVEHLCSNGGLPSLRMLILNFTPASRVALEFLLEHCPKLECLQLHITLQLYFPESTHSKPDTFSTYEQIVANLRKLESHHKGRGVFQLFEHYSGITTKTN